MSMNFNFEPVCPHHDLLTEFDQDELGIDGFDESERDDLQPDLQSRMDSLLEALDHLSA